MNEELNEGIFDAALKKAFCDYTDNLLDSFPDCETLSEKYPLSKKEERFFERIMKEKKYGKPLALVYLSRAAVIFLCFVTLAAAVMLSSPTVRAAVKNVFMQWFEKYTLFTFVQTEPGKDDFQNVEDVKIGYIPEGYELGFEDKLPKAFTYIYYSRDNDPNKDIMIEIIENGVVDTGLDNEYSKLTKTKINGHDAWINYSENNCAGTVILVGTKITVQINAILPKEELVKIAENIR
ncbi:MAG: DUF4367 domain-containing protein [Clostridia bacterium]|nr:DUF4367 domain-containing protein [Clostridia bacterium]